MDLREYIARRVRDQHMKFNGRLFGVPVPVMEEIVKAAIDEVGNMPLAKEGRAALDAVFGQEWGHCEACSEMFPAETLIVGDDCDFCAECFQEEKLAAAMEAEEKRSVKAHPFTHEARCPGDCGDGMTQHNEPTCDGIWGNPYPLGMDQTHRYQHGDGCDGRCNFTCVGGDWFPADLLPVVRP